MDYKGLVKSLDVPAGYTPPSELAYEDIRARALGRADLHDDVRGSTPASTSSGGLVAAAGRRRRSARTSMTSTWSGTNLSSAKDTHSRAGQVSI
jgi:hypothetical protein